MESAMTVFKLNNPHENKKGYEMKYNSMGREGEKRHNEWRGMEE